MASKQFVMAFPSAARTASPTDAIIDTRFYAGVSVLINVTAIVSTPSVVFNIKGRDPSTGTEWLILASAAVTAVSNVQLDIFPGTDETANLSENAYLPMEIVIDPVHADADSITYSVGVLLLP